MAYAYSDESNKHLKVHFECDRMNRCPSLSCYTSSSCSFSSRSSMEEPYDFDKADFDSSPEANQPDLIEPPAPAPSPEVSPQTTVPQIPMASGRPSGYDPTRLPPAMFAAKPSSAMDWSVASNESLFSIHVGNSSFSKDQYSNELGKLEEMVETLETDRHSVSVDTKSVESRSDISEEENFDINIVTGNVEKDEETEETIRLPTIEETKGSAFSRRSDESNQSFQFPV